VGGNSLGGWAALELGVRGRARSVTAIAPAGGYDGFLPRDLVMGMAFLATATARSGLRATNLVPHLPLRRAALRALAHDTSLIDPATARLVAATALGASHPLQVLLACIRSIPARRLEEIEVPVHLVFAEHDRVIPPRLYAPYFTERIAHARVTHLAGVGHCPQVEAPQTVADLVRETVAWAARAHLAEAR
jgi:pimeloyl-ACP methyl ester carboxylesterase